MPLEPKMIRADHITGQHQPCIEIQKARQNTPPFALSSCTIASRERGAGGHGLERRISGLLSEIPSTGIESCLFELMNEFADVPNPRIVERRSASK